MRLLPRSLIGQVLLAVALALLIAQALSAALLWRASEQRRDAAMVQVAAMRLLAEPGWRAQMERHMALRRAGEGARGLPRSLRLEERDRFALPPAARRDPASEEALTAILAAEGLAEPAVVVGEIAVGDDPFARGILERRPRWRASPGGGHQRRLMIAALRTGETGPWRIARVIEPPTPPGALGRILFQTMILFLVLVGGLALLLRRITRPLAALTDRVTHFAGKPDGGDPLVPRGPEDVSRLITAHNAMENRIAALLDEKDVMLGAIGHDLRTPLSALRVRIENVSDPAERARMAAMIDDVAASLDDILTLARVGRPGDAREKTDLSALVLSVVDEFEDLGEPVEAGTTERLRLSVRPTWLRRAVRNLIVNALRYGGSANVSLLRADGEAVIRVEDTGPGIPAAEIERMTEPFTRGEPSRNRRTGGAGLGLTLARAIAEQHGGRLVLANRDDGGLRAEIRLPAPAA